jgi:putative oxidoreductase
MDIALLILRLVVGLYLIGHGSQKLFGWFGGGGLSGTSQHMRGIGFRPALPWTLAAGLAEAGGGLLLALGLLSPLGSLGVIAAMLVASFSAHWGKGLLGMTGGPELPFTYIAVAVAVAIAGPGRYALDSWLGIALPEPITGLVLSALTLLGVVVAMATRRTQPAAGGESRPSAA